VDHAALKMPDTSQLKPRIASQTIAALTEEWCTDDRVVNLWMGKNNIPAKAVYEAYNCHVRAPSLVLAPYGTQYSAEEKALWATKSYKQGQLVVCYSGTYVNDKWLEANAESELVKYVPIPIYICCSLNVLSKLMPNLPVT
jgi:hypothetical protein